MLIWRILSTLPLLARYSPTLAGPRRFATALEKRPRKTEPQPIRARFSPGQFVPNKELSIVCVKRCDKDGGAGGSST